MMKKCDFNDLHQSKGLKVIQNIIEGAIKSEELLSDKLSEAPLNSLISPPNLINALHSEDPIAPPIMDPSGFYGILGRVANISCENSEADPIAVCSYFLARFGATIGRSVSQAIGDGELHARPFFIVVGKSAKSRKGTSENFPKKLFDYTEKSKNLNMPLLKVHTGGLSSGEGIGYSLRDASEKMNSVNSPKDDGIKDKRMLVIEPEFANILTMSKRDGNILSSTIRNIWDGRDIEPLTKNNRWKASNPHCTIVGHITAYELIEKLTNNEMANGFLNRFILLYVSRKKLVPNPLPTNQRLLESLSDELVKVFEFLNSCASETEPLVMCFDDAAMSLWCRVYADVSKDRPGVEGMLLARSETYARMLSMIFALLDNSKVIKIEHLNAGLAWLNFWIDSIRYIFKNQKQITEQEHTQELAEHIFEQISEASDGLSRTDVSEKNNNHLTKKQVDNALEILLTSVPPKIIATRIKTNGPTKTIYTCAK